MEHNDWRTIRSTPLFSSLSQDVTESIVSSQGVRTYEKGTLLFQQDSPSDSFFVILDGWVKLFRITPNGTEAIVGVLRRGESFGEAAIFMGRQYPVAAEIVTTSRLLKVDGESFRRRICVEPELALAILASLSQHLKFLVGHIEQIKVLDASQRVADFLIGLCNQAQGSSVIILPYEKALIAKRLGMTPESLSRALAKLRPLGISVHQENVTIADVAVLRKHVAMGRNSAAHT
ncbi:Crp/Fnr family transcriptional regulator [Hyphomicrobium denitrificans 1NES1]|uniref:Crp/Fnr family transcriptional regulator n=1 Tax=Hyphomicrobium denitrificans 1NES1 TaxID=670307 RepID=N0AZZ1_9HYPH|nr:cyclic nucleotide-binding domain-containing protein [Hyphomicrobium denitrificans]AGK56769.1 Crp/Fnr family transcriptional regulator [Hyphomicrobium denitrificans 1NES1]